MDLEDRLKERLRDLEWEFKRKAQPILDELARLDAMKSRVPVHVATAVKRDDCPTPANYGSDEYKCLKCGRIWGTDEERPDCYFLG